jgi:hypothetical protein
MDLQSAVEGQTEPIIHQLLNEGEPVAIQGMMVELVLQKRDGIAINTSGKITNLDDGTEPNRGKVRYSPDAADLTKAGSPYFVRWKVTDVGGKIAFWSNAAADRLTVYPVGKS